MGPKPEIWDPFFFKFSKQNPFCPKCRQGFLCQKKNVPAPFGTLPAHFLRGPEKSKNCPNFVNFPWWANGPYSPGLGPLLLLPQVSNSAAYSNRSMLRKVSLSVRNNCLLVMLSLGAQMRCKYFAKQSNLTCLSTHRKNE